MKYSDVIRQAAITAKLLGYRLQVSEYMHVNYLYVIPPDGLTINAYENQYLNRVCSFKSEYFDRNSEVLWPKVSETEALGHFLVRLHMEQHFGIKTVHYWKGNTMT